MRPGKWLLLAALMLSAVTALLLLTTPRVSQAAYHHMGEVDSGHFLAVYPEAAGTKLDSCTLCHAGGSQTSGGKTTNYGSCQWCHLTYGYDAQGDILATLNGYGADYLTAGRSADAVRAIEARDSDGDGYANKDEIAAVRYPGDAKDDPTKVAAPYRVFTRAELEAMPQHTQFLLMNASKSTDTYAEYSGVTMERLLSGLATEAATNIIVYSPDGFSQYHPMLPEAKPSSYHVIGSYPDETYFYNDQADFGAHPTTGWTDYTAAQAKGLENGDTLANPQGLKLLLAFKRDGNYLAPGVLNLQNKLDGEGPFRVVPPQKTPCPPDQRSTATSATDPTVWVWPYVSSVDHNAGYSTRTTTIIKVEPLPAGTTDIDTLEAGWNYVDQDKIVVYGAIDPTFSVAEKLGALGSTISAVDASAIKQPNGPTVLAQKVAVIKKLVQKGNYAEALQKMQDDVVQKADGCTLGSGPDKNDWILSCDLQKQINWAAHEVEVLLATAP